MLIYNEISEIGAKALAKSTLEILDLCLNIINDDGAIALSMSKTIQELLVSACGITDIGGMALANNNVLKSLFIGKNELTDKSAKTFSDNTSLIILHLGANQITGNGEKVLKMNKRLKDLDLVGNPIEETPTETNQLNEEKPMIKPEKLSKLTFINSLKKFAMINKNLKYWIYHPRTH